MTEGEFIKRYLKSMASNMRLFRINAGMGWAGDIIKRTPQILCLKKYRPLRAAPVGWSDLVGWEETEVTPDMVGKKIAVFTAKEAKVTGRLTREQKIFGNVLESMGGNFEVIKPEH